MITNEPTTTTSASIMALDNQYVMHTYGRLPVVFVRGEGCFVYDADGNEYLDLVAGIAVNGLGHCHPEGGRGHLQTSRDADSYE